VTPQIQYAHTRDGVNIAYWTMGSGSAVFSQFLPASHLEREWTIPGLRAIYEGAARVGRFVRFDHRGFGLSDREVPSFNVDALVLDLEAVTDALELERFALVSYDISVTIALAYAAQHPERLSHLVLVHGSARGADLMDERLHALYSFAKRDYEFFSESAVRVLYGYAQEERARSTAATLREAIEPAKMIEFIDQVERWDVADRISKIETPTLILHRREHRLFGVDVARRLTAGIPGARLVVLDGPDDPFIADMVPVIGRFLVGARELTPRRDSPSASTGRLTTTSVLLLADVVGSTELVGRLGDVRYRELVRALDRRLGEAIQKHAGAKVRGRNLGDGLLATFASARAGIDAAFGCADAAHALGVALHLGLHAGDVIRDGDDLFGGTVNVVARVSALAGPNEVLVSATVRELARTSTDVEFEDRGDRQLRGVAEPVRLYAARRG
jgi:class 3 adenylate cyclase/pimeloyl-ACP methyl ester carboxylesterase